MSIPICTICGTAMLYIPCPGLQPRCSVAHYSCPNGPEDSPYHKLFLELVAVRKIAFEYKERIAELDELAATLGWKYDALGAQLADKDARIVELEKRVADIYECPADPPGSPTFTSTLTPPLYDQLVRAQALIEDLKAVLWRVKCCNITIDERALCSVCLAAVTDALAHIREVKDGEK